METNRIDNYLRAVENGTLDNYHRKYGRYYGLQNCPVCRSCKRLYIVKKENEEVMFARCTKCDFFYNPFDLPVPTRYHLKNFIREDTRRNRGTSPKYILYEKYRKIL